MESPRDRSTLNLLRFAGISGGAIALGYVFITVGFVISGPALPRDGVSWVTYLDGKTGLWWGIIWASVATDLLYLPVAWGLYERLRETSRALVSVGAALLSLFVVLELATTWSDYPALIELVQRHRAATTDAQRALFLAAIEHCSIQFQTPVHEVYNIVTPSLGVVLASVAMLRGKQFARTVAIIGLLSGSLNIISVVGGWMWEPMRQLVVPGSFLSLFWFLGVGIRLPRGLELAPPAAP